MIRKNIRIIIAAAAAAALLCSCGSNGMTSEFAKLKNAAESKSGIIYKTTYFVSSEGSDGFPYPESDEESGKLRFVYNDEENNAIPLTDYCFEDARGSYLVDENKYIAPACLNEKWGYVLLDISAPDTETVTWEIEPQYENAECFTEQTAAVMKDGKYGIINENGELIVPFMYDSIKYRSFGYFPAGLDGEWYFISGDNERIFGPFEDAESFEYGYAAVKKDGKWGFINKNGVDATDYVYDEAYSVESDGCAWVRTGDKWEKVIVRETME